jgi:hypothetical protein
MQAERLSVGLDAEAVDPRDYHRAVALADLRFSGSA